MFSVCGKTLLQDKKYGQRLQEIYKKFCLPTRKRAPENAPQYQSVFKRSELAGNYYAGQLFGMESYDECVAMLYNELEGFFRELVESLALCRLIILEESNIRSTPSRCKEIYYDCYGHMVSNSRSMLRLFKESHLVPSDELEERRRSAGSLQNFICENFHMLDPSQFQSYVVVCELKKGMNNGLTETEIKLYGSENMELVEKVRLVIAHFDELEDSLKGKNKDKHSAYGIASFMLWSGIGETQDDKVKTFVEYFNLTYKGVYSPAKTNAVNTAKNKIKYPRTGDKSNFNDAEFRSKIEKLIGKYTSKDDVA